MRQARFSKQTTTRRSFQQLAWKAMKFRSKKLWDTDFLDQSKEIINKYCWRHLEWSSVAANLLWQTKRVKTFETTNSANPNAFWFVFVPVSTHSQDPRNEKILSGRCCFLTVVSRNREWCGICALSSTGSSLRLQLACWLIMIGSSNVAGSGSD